MAFVHGKTVHFEIDNSGGSPVDISAYEMKVDFPRTADTAETSTFGSTDKTFLPGLKGATMTIDGYFDATADAVLSGIIGVSGSFIYGPAGNTGGYTKYSGECICTAYNVSGEVGAIVKATASFTINGAVSRGTF